jgi:hypothetical protein
MALSHARLIADIFAFFTLITAYHFRLFSFAMMLPSRLPRRVLMTRCFYARQSVRAPLFRCHFRLFSFSSFDFHYATIDFRAFDIDYCLAILILMSCATRWLATRLPATPRQLLCACASCQLSASQPPAS